METLIVICLLGVIFLLLEDKFEIKKRSRSDNNQEKSSHQLSDIMGLPKPTLRLSASSRAYERQNKNLEEQDDNLDIDINEEDFDIEIPQEELDEVFLNRPDLYEEEEEWMRNGVVDDEDGFATGVTFEELGTVGMVLRAEKPEPSLEKQVVDIVHRIQGTELFNLLENSIEGASRTIAELLDQSLSLETEPSSSILRKKDVSDFDIDEFV